MNEILLKRKLPDDIYDKFEKGRIAHVVLVTRRRENGVWKERLIICMSSKHEYIDQNGGDGNPNGEDPGDWERLLGDADDDEEEVELKISEPPDVGVDPMKESRSTNEMTPNEELAVAMTVAGEADVATIDARLSTSYRKCKQTGKKCYLLITETRRTCKDIGGSGAGLSLCKT